jgi:hypothetical protein
MQRGGSALRDWRAHAPSFCRRTARQETTAPANEKSVRVARLKHFIRTVTGGLRFSGNPHDPVTAAVTGEVRLWCGTRAV